MNETTPAPKPKRRWYQFHLWHLFVLMTVVALGCGLVAWLAEAYREGLHAYETYPCVIAMRESGGGVGGCGQFVNSLHLCEANAKDGVLKHATTWDNLSEVTLTGLVISTGAVLITSLD